ncbi:sigma factor [Acidaminobacter hydrogenoformans]|uniref:sigma factor n=1 Tax=Acidaminobacter hydrogenoformans TaxID=65403 RepID=UPI00147AA4DD|nr:sigma factor [Acidaminobacter hydrogenoformans]
MSAEIKIDYDARNRELYQRFKDGDAKALEEMLEFNRPLAMKWANKYFRAAKLEYRPSLDREDLESMAMIGAWRAITEKWDPDRGPLSTVIIWTIKTEFREVFRVGMSVSLNTPAGKNEDGQADQQSMLPDLDAVDPELQTYASERCQEYFSFMADHADPVELKRLKAYCLGYIEQPSRKSIESALITGPQPPLVKAFRERWLGSQLSYYPSPMASMGNVRPTLRGHADPTGDKAMMRIELLERLENKLQNRLGVKP